MKYLARLPEDCGNDLQIFRHYDGLEVTKLGVEITEDTYNWISWEQELRRERHNEIVAAHVAELGDDQEAIAVYLAERECDAAPQIIIEEVAEIPASIADGTE